LSVFFDIGEDESSATLGAQDATPMRTQRLESDGGVKLSSLTLQGRIEVDKALIGGEC